MPSDGAGRARRDPRFEHLGGRDPSLSSVPTTSRATVAIGQATANSVDSRVYAAPSNTAATALITSGAWSHTASTSAWYVLPDTMVAPPPLVLPARKWW